MGTDISAYKIYFISIDEVKIKLERSKYGWENNIKIIIGKEGSRIFTWFRTGATVGF
jgi:hypothetical protein